MNLRTTKAMRAQRRGLRGIATLDKKPLLFARYLRRSQRGDAHESLRLIWESDGRKPRVLRQPEHGIAKGIVRDGVH